jgi:putative ABC transport system permease protein
MFRLTLHNLAARKARLLLTAIAVMLGVAFVAGTFVLTDTINKAYDGIAATKYAETSVVVRSDRSVDAGRMGTTHGTIPASLVGQVRSVDGVAAADAAVEGVARLVGRDGKLVDANVEQATPIGMAWATSDALNPLELVAGRAPGADDEVVIDRTSARDGGFAPGDSVQVVTNGASARYRVAGIATYGSADDAGGAGVVAFTPATAVRVLGETGRVDSVRAVADAGVSQRELAARVRTALDAHGDGHVQVMTGTAAVDDARTESRKGVSFMSTFLLVFAIVALIVGSFVIFNAFSITVAQRTRETALLRAIGSTRRQVLRMVVAEAFVTGVVASAAGTVFGIGLAHGLRALLTGFGLELPGGSTLVTSRTIVISMVLGTVVTVIAAYLPARRASRVAPIAAMRDVAVDTTGRSRRRAVIGTVTTVLGALLLAAGIGGAGAAAVAAGTLGVFAGVVVLGPVVAPRFVRLVGTPVAKLHGMTGVLARDNAARNPKRTSATASALMIGVGLVVLMSVFAASARTSVGASVDKAVHSDWIIDTIQVQDGLSPSVARAIDALPETASVTSIRYTPVALDGTTVQVAAIDPANVERHLDIGVQSGSVAALDGHGSGTWGLGVYETTAEKNGWHLGDDVTLSFAETGAQHFTVAAVYGIAVPMGEYVVSQQAYEANVARSFDSYVVIKNAPGTSEGSARQAIEGVLADTPSGTLHTVAEFRRSASGEIDKMLNLIYVLLFLAVVIALFGIANTLALSVVERRRELGLLRAVGMQRSQLRASVRWEAALIALLGTAVGTALGLGFGGALVKAMESQGIDHLAIPGARLVVVALVATVAAVVAAALPARRAARLDVLDSIAG